MSVQRIEAFLERIPYARFLGIEACAEAGSDAMAVLRFSRDLIGNVTLPALPRWGPGLFPGNCRNRRSPRRRRQRPAPQDHRHHDRLPPIGQTPGHLRRGIGSQARTAGLERPRRSLAGASRQTHCRRARTLLDALREPEARPRQSLGSKTLLLQIVIGPPRSISLIAPVDRSRLKWWDKPAHRFGAG